MDSRLSTLLVLLCFAQVGAAQSASPASGAWEFLEKQFYGSRDIGVVDESFMTLEAPATTPDPAATPLTVRFGAAAIGRVRQLRVIVDNNPSPVVSTFDLSPGARVGAVGLRVRVDRFTSIRAIAETLDGRLEMRSQWVNASGGCSAPPAAAARGTLGEMRFRTSADAKSLQVSIRHPNNSGFQIDPLSGEAIPPHFVKHLRFLVAGQPLVDAELGISISENPTVTLASDQAWASPVTVEGIDSKEARFTQTWVRDAAARP